MATPVDFGMTWKGRSFFFTFAYRNAGEKHTRVIERFTQDWDAAFGTLPADDQVVAQVAWNGIEDADPDELLPPPRGRIIVGTFQPKWRDPLGTSIIDPDAKAELESEVPANRQG